MTTHGLPGLPLPNNKTALIVDDTDPTVKYTPARAWFFEVSSNRQYNSSRTGTNSTNARAQFTFTGTGIEVWGTVGSYDVYGVPLSTYAIDDGPQVSFSAPLVDPGFVRAPVQYFQSARLSAAQHTLTITNVNGTAPSLLWIDYFVYTPDPRALASSSASAGAGSTASGVPSSTGSDAPAQTSDIAPTSPPADKGSKTNVGAIAGGVVGGLLLLALALLALLCLRKRRRRHAYSAPGAKGSDVLTSELAPTPLALGGAQHAHASGTGTGTPYSNPYERYQGGSAPPAAPPGVPILGAPPPGRRKGAGGPASPTALGGTAAAGTVQTNARPPASVSTEAQEVPVQHQDSGIRIRDIPPVYTQE